MDIKNKILIIDDQEINIDIIAGMLGTDYDILTAISGELALKIIDNQIPDLIISDINMPNMDGFELAQQILNNDKTSEIPIIFVSSEDEESFKDKGFSLGGVDYITKPVNSNELKRKIAIWLRIINGIKENKKYISLLNEYKNTVDRSSIVSKTNQYGKITYVNDKFCEISGYTREELLGKSHSIVRHEDMKSNIFDEMWKTIKSKKPWFGIIKNKTKYGKTYFVDTVISPIVDEKGKIIEYIGMRHDITELEEYKDILKDELILTNKSYQENINYIMQYESIINDVNAVLKTDTNNIITFVNQKMCKISGYDKEELIGFNYNKLQDTDSSNDYLSINNALSNRKKIVKLLKNKTKLGDSFYVNTFFSPIIDLDGNIIEYLQIMHDVTEIINLNKEIIDTQKEIVFTMGAIGEARSKETGFHVKRVAEYSYLLAILYGLDEEYAQRIKQASPMHDIGKVGIPDNILNKPGKLTEEEYEIMKTHAQLGYEMLKHSNREILKTASIIAYTHHEKFNGTGYPNNITGNDIPIEGRITAIADVFDALGHDRCYKKAWELEDILNLFKNEKGKHFDPVLIDLFFENLDKFLEIQKKFESE